MKKKVNVFGKSIPVLAIFVLGIALVSAALVPYLSGMVTGEVSTQSPIKQEISSDGSTWVIDGTLPLVTLYGGGVNTLHIRDTNLASVPITGVAENRVTNPEGVTCGDFESVVITTTTTIPSETTTVSSGDLINDASGVLCVQDGTDSVLFMWGPNAPASNTNTWAVGQEDTSEIVATFRVNTIGTYTFTSQVMTP